MHSSGANNPESVPYQDQLVAYLDGELDGETTRRIEELLGTDPRLESELRRLQGAWDLLDRLGRAEVNPQFTRSTVEMIALSQADEVAQEQAAEPRRRRFMRLAAALGIGIAGLIGYASARHFVPDPNERLLDNLAIVENFDAYRQADEITFLRALHLKGMFATEQKRTPNGSEPDSQEAPEPPRRDDQKTAAARLAGLDPQAQDQLLRQLERFQKLTPTEQERLRALDLALAADPQADALWTVMQRYHRWLSELPTATRAELLNQSPDDRLERIAALRAKELGPKDLRVIRLWMAGIGREQLTDEKRKELKELPEQDRTGFLVMQFWQGGPRFGGGISVPYSQEELAPLRKALSEPARRQLDQATTSQTQFNLFWDWQMQMVKQRGAGRSGNGPLDPSDSEFKKKLEAMSPEERAKLLEMPAEDVQRMLRPRRAGDWDRGRGFRRGFPNRPAAPKPAPT